MATPLLKNCKNRKVSSLDKTLSKFYHRFTALSPFKAKMLTETEVLYSISLIKKNPELLAHVYIEQMSEIALTTLILLMQNLAFVKH